MRCPFCETSIVVPKELRPANAPSLHAASSFYPNQPSAPARPKHGLAKAVVFFLCILSLIIAAIVFTVIRTVDNAATSFQSTDVPAIIGALTAAPTAAPTVAPSPTPAYAQAVMHFGSKGIGPGGQWDQDFRPGSKPC